MENPTITIHTDGSSRGNPGRGGYGIVLTSGKFRKEVSEGYRKTTNNRMELLAVIVALEMLKIDGSNVTIHTDSMYVSEAINKKWIESWIKKGFKNVKNPDLWQRFLRIYEKHNVKFVWLKGHAGYIENERCDELATNAAIQKDLKIDEYYENLNSNLFGNSN